MTLEGYKAIGVISENYILINKEEMQTITASRLRTLPRGRITHRLNVIIDNAEWVAIEKEGEVITNVLSSNGDDVMFWIKDSLMLLTQTIKNNYLVTKKIEEFGKNIKRRTTEMAGIDLGLNLDELDVFEKPAAAPAAGAVSEARGASNQKLFSYMSRYGRLMAFVTSETPTVKMSVRKNKITDAQGHYVKDKNLTPEQEAEIAAAGKVSAKYAATENAFTFRQSSPALKAAIIAIPTTIAESNDIIGEAIAGTLKFDENCKETSLVPLTKEGFFTTVKSLFGGKITESDAVMGKKATTLSVDYIKYEKKDSTTKQPTGEMGLRPKVSISEGVRSTFITEGNFIPLKNYETASPQNPSAEEAEGLNMAIEQVLKSKEKYDTLREADKDLISWDEASDNHVTSKYFVAGQKGIDIKVPAFYDKKVNVAEIQIPLKKKEVKTDNKGETKIKYSAKSHSYEDLAEGPLSETAYQAVLSKIGIKPEEFISIIKPVVTVKKETKKKQNILSNEEFTDILLTNNRAGSYNVTGAITLDLNGLGRKLAGLPM